MIDTLIGFICGFIVGGFCTIFVMACMIGRHHDSQVDAGEEVRGAVRRYLHDGGRSASELAARVMDALERAGV